MAPAVMVTGANGFVGRAVVERLLRDGTSVRTALRRAPLDFDTAGGTVVIGEIDGATDWRSALIGAEAVVHCAARVHRLNENSVDPLAAFRAVNCDGTANLARQAAAAGVRRFVFLSSIKVNGESTPPGRPFRADDAPAPVDPYGISKNEAEIALRQVASRTGMEVVIVRPPLVYGPGVKANFREMLKWLHRGVPLPLGALDNRRSIVAIDNLVDLAVTCLRHPAPLAGTFLVSDGEDLSTTELLRRAARALGRRARLVPVPPSWLRGGARLIGRSDLADRLCGSLQVDLGPTRAALAWTPPAGIDDTLVRTAQQFLRNPH